MPTINISSTSGTISNSDPSYSIVRNAPSGDTVTVYPTSGIIGQREHLGSYNIRRGYMAFDTSAILLTPSSATINLYVTMGSGANYYVTDSSAPDLVTNLAITDYDAYAPNGAYTSLITITSDGWISVTLDAYARNAMNTSSVFKIMIVGSGDYSGTPPSIETEELDNFDFSGNIPYISYVEGTLNEIYSINKNSINLLSTINNISIVNLNKFLGINSTT